MDSIVNLALEEICSQVEDGINVKTLWSKLEEQASSSSFDLDSNLPLSPSLKRAIWSNLLLIPTLRFEPPNPSSELEEAENLNLKIFPKPNLADNFVGLYDSQSLQNAQTRVLILLAKARANGITQTQLAKQLRIDPNNFHYVLRSLECQGLIVKQSALEKKKQKSGTFTVTTHLVYLHRYAKQLDSYQRFEFITTHYDDDEEGGNTPQTDVLLKDYAPQMNAICDKLSKANGKVVFYSILIKFTNYLRI